MNNSKIDLIWAASVIALAIAALLLCGTALFDIELPDALTRFTGAIGLIALPIASWSTVRKYQSAKQRRE